MTKRNDETARLQQQFDGELESDAYVRDNKVFIKTASGDVEVIDRIADEDYTWDTAPHDPKTLKEWLQFCYFRYLIYTSLYMLERWERNIFHIISIFVIAMICYSTVVYLPHYTVRLMTKTMENIKYFVNF